ncbi:hypothetical protein SPH9361_04601 [Sphingobium sp. CECT 9361]|nr:hypothetical protein SPH9361_04601 [Sphingobium sp. CECT 9361]
MRRRCHVRAHMGIEPAMGIFNCKGGYAALPLTRNAVLHSAVLTCDCIFDGYGSRLMGAV